MLASAPMDAGEHAKPVKSKITLHDKRCELNQMLYIACQTYCEVMRINTYMETSTDGIDKNCMCCSYARWKEMFGNKKLSLRPPASAATAATTFPAKPPDEGAAHNAVDEISTSETEGAAEVVILDADS